MKLTDLVTMRLRRVVPKCACDLQIEPTGIRYLHPTKGWRRVSQKRIGVIFS